MIKIRSLKKEEVRKASELADLTYSPELYESLEVFERKREFFPEGFLGLFINNQFFGYIICHPWNSDKEVKLNYLLREEDRGDWFYIRDLVIEKSKRERGYGEKMLSYCIRLGERRGFRKFMLVAVNEADKDIAKKLEFKIDKEINYNGIKAFRMKRII